MTQMQIAAAASRQGYGSQSWNYSNPYLNPYMAGAYGNTYGLDPFTLQQQAAATANLSEAMQAKLGALNQQARSMATAVKAAAQAKLSAKAQAKAKVTAKVPSPKTAPPPKPGPGTPGTAAAPKAAVSPLAAPLAAPAGAPAVAGLLPKSPAVAPSSLNSSRSTRSGSSFAAALSAGLASAAVAGAAGARKTGSRSAKRVACRAESTRREPQTARSAVTDQLVTSVDPSLGPQGTYQVGIDFKNWLQSAQEEIKVDGLRVEGQIPAWLRGHLAVAPGAGSGVSGTLSGVHTVFSISPRDRANDFAMESDSAAEDLVETVATEIPYSATWPEELQRYLLKRGVEDYVIQDRFGAEVLGSVQPKSFYRAELFPLRTNRLQHVTHLSSVSGGSIAASGFASFLVEAHRAAGASPSRTPSAGPLYREVVADFIERSQRNAGYLVSFQNLFQAQIWDLPLMFLVVLGVLVAAPSVFCVFYVVPVTMLIEAYWGGAMRPALIPGVSVAAIFDEHWQVCAHWTRAEKGRTLS
eukprot:g23613.t1